MKTIIWNGVSSMHLKSQNDGGSIVLFFQAREEPNWSKNKPNKTCVLILVYSMRIFIMIEKNESRPSDRMVRWSRQEVPESAQTKVPGDTKIWGQVPKRVGPNTNVI